MYRGSTPTLAFVCDSSLEDATTLEILCAQTPDCRGEVRYTLAPENLDAAKGTFTISLTEEQTYSFHAGFPVKFQLRAEDDARHIDYSNIVSLRVYDTLETNASAKNSDSSCYTTSHHCTFQLRFSGEFTKMGEYDEYSGAYTVTPSFVSQTLQTKGKALTSDITIQAIQATETDNSAGGITLEI